MFTTQINDMRQALREKTVKYSLIMCDYDPPVNESITMDIERQYYW